MTLDVQSLRNREFPTLSAGGAIYLNAASTGPLPERCVETMTRWIRRRAAPHTLPDKEVFDTIAKSRNLIAQLIGASQREIGLGINTGFGLNLAARSLPLGSGDVVVTPDRDFPANMYPWGVAAAERGFTYRRIAVEDGEPQEDVLLRAIEQPGVKCLSVSWVHFATGQLLDIARLGRACRERGIFFVVDAIQGLGVLPFNVHESCVDIAASGAQKWLLSPWGSGFVYVREELLPQLNPAVVGWMAPKGTGDFRHLREYNLTWRDDARRFELITLPYQDLAGMNESLGLLLEIGALEISEHVTRLTNEIVRWALLRSDVRLVTPTDPEHRAGIVCFKPADGERVSNYLKEKGVAHSLREGSIRFAPHLYNTIDEVRQALDYVEAAA